jgi:hypothetical protein
LINDNQKQQPNQKGEAFPGKSEAALIYFEKTDRRKLLWQTSQMYFIVSAGLSEEEIIKMGESLGK